MNFEDQKTYTKALQFARTSFEEVFPEFFDKNQGAHGQIIEPITSFSQTILNNANKNSRVIEKTTNTDGEVEEVSMGIEEIWQKLWKHKDKFQGKTLKLLIDFNKQYEEWKAGESPYPSPFSNKQEIVIMNIYEDL